jgi:restriction system protein
MGTAMDREPAVWVVRAGRGGRYAAEFEAHGMVAIGFSDFPSVAGLTREEITSLATADLAPAAAGVAAGQLLRFAQEIHVGDLVVSPD